jgi:hypothetical protein
MTPTFNFTTEIERGDDVFEIEVEYSCTPFVAATYWQPAEGGEVELTDTQLNGEHFPLTDAEEAKVLTEAENRAHQDFSDWANTDWEE